MGSLPHGDDRGGSGRPGSDGVGRSGRSGFGSRRRALPDVTLADGTVDLEGVRITLSLSPQPPVAFAKMRVRVRAASTAAADKLLTLEGGRVSFEMSMPMGDHRYSLVPGADGWQEADVVLPLCPSGKRRWYATVEGTVAGRAADGPLPARPGTAAIAPTP